ncbi:MAG: hypothetical protein ACI9LM_001021 [Alteromonadaceae bacterium]|jgi:hypothetical protein
MRRSTLMVIIKLFATLVDRFLFTISFIMGVQLPEFIVQYTQRLSGHLNEARYQLQQFQLIADNHFQGDLAMMIKRYQENTEASIIETGDLIASTKERITLLEQHLTDMTQKDLVNRLYAFVTEYDFAMAQATVQQFQLAIPLNYPALSTGAIVALILLLTYKSITAFARRLYRKSNHNKWVH